jgi:hypothetical protein
LLFRGRTIRLKSPNRQVPEEVTMTRVVIVGEIYNADLSVGGGPIYPGGPPARPDQGLPPYPAHPIAPGGGQPPGYWGGSNPHPDQGLPGAPPGYWGGVAPPRPDQGLPGQPPGYWGGSSPHPDHGLPGGQGGVPTHPIHIPGVPDQGLPPGEPIPPDQVTPPQLPEGHEDDLVVAVKQPGQEDWTYTSYAVQPDQGQPAPEPHSRRRK